MLDARKFVCHMESMKRRKLLAAAATVGAVLLLSPGSAAAAGKNARKKEEAEVAPGEDLMREHGVLRRVMFLYDEAAIRLDGGGQKPPLDSLAAAAGIVRR